MSKILVLDFGGQYKELIARRIRSLNVYSEIVPGNSTAEEILEKKPDGIILTGGPNSVYLPDSQLCAPELFNIGIPVLGICYGMQLMVHTLGGRVAKGDVSEFGVVNAVYRGEPRDVLMSHGDRVWELPEGFTVTASTKDCPIAAAENPQRKLYAVQFHPEVTLTERGTEIIEDFLFNVCGVQRDYFLDDVIETLCAQIREQVGNDKILLGLSGGVDSSVVAALLSRAVPGQTLCVFVDHGLMRLNEGDQIEEIFGKRDLEFLRVNAEKRFLSKLSGVTDPERKRKIIGKAFVRTFESVAKSRGYKKCWLAQGTIYPDVIESGASKTGGAAVIKSHHNVGGMPKKLKLKGLVEPLRGLFKDEVRALGRKLGLPSELVERQPFPGPGLAIRIIGGITKEKLDVLRQADAIFREAVDIMPFEERPAQYFAVLTDTQAVGVVGDARSYGTVLALRAVYTDDFMTCRYVPLPHELLDRVSRRITNTLHSIGRIVYDITDKPPATLEWE